MINFRYGPDGSVHVIDWYDKNQCHSTNPDIHQKTLGRIFKISYQTDKWVKVDLAKLSSERLVEMQLNRNDWYVQHARRLLQERGPDPRVHSLLKQMLRDNPDVTRKLRALWALHVTQGLTEQELIELMGHENEYVRSWAIQLSLEASQPSAPLLRQFAKMAREDQSPLVRLYLASGLQRVPVEKRWDVLEALMTHAEDASDPNLPLMVWYAAEPLVALDMPRAITLAGNSKLPRLFSFAAQRIGAIGSQDALRVLADRLGQTADPVRQKDLAGAIVQIVGRN
jgi:hypothetical protein